MVVGTMFEKIKNNFKLKYLFKILLSVVGAKMFVVIVVIVTGVYSW